MTVRFPDSDRPIRHKDLAQLEGTIAYLSGRLREAERETEGVRYRLDLAEEDAAVLRKKLKSFRVEREAEFVDERDGRAISPADVVKVVLKLDSSLLGDARRDARVGLDNLELVVRQGSNPQLRVAPVLAGPGDEYTVFETGILANDEAELVVSLDVHPDRDAADSEQGVADHHSSPSVGVDSHSEPTGGEAPTRIAMNSDMSGRSSHEIVQRIVDQIERQRKISRKEGL